MAYFQKYTVTTANQFLIDLSAFLAANGWSVDFDGVYQTSYRRLHFHKGSAHFDLYSSAATTLYMYHCTGYASGSAPSAQPGTGTGSGRNFSITVNAFYWFVSTVGAVYLGLTDAAGASFSWGGFYVIQSKIGAWADGFGSFCPTYNALFADSSGSAPYYNQIYVNGSWGTISGAGAVSGSSNTSDLPTKGPNFYNAGLVPIPVLVSIFHSTDFTKRVPIGWAPGLYRANGGDIYDIGDQLIIGSDTYLILPKYGPGIGTTSYGDYLFKLGA